MGEQSLQDNLRRRAKATHDAVFAVLFDAAADRLDAQEVRIAELEKANDEADQFYRTAEKDFKLAKDAFKAANKRIAELEEALKELDACMDFNEEVQPGEMGIESPENINAAFKKAAALIAQQEQAHD